jgi:hypothetical protein
MSEKSTSDELVLKLLDKVEAKKKEIGQCERPQWLTNCTFTFPDTNKVVNIQTADIATLCFLMGYLEYRTSLIIDGAKTLKVKASTDFNGSSVTDWASDLATRANQIQIKTKKEELAELERRVNGLVSPEQRREMELNKLAKEIGV